MTKTKALAQLTLDFQNNLIAKGYRDIKDIDDDLDREMAKALKISLLEKGGKQ